MKSLNGARMVLATHNIGKLCEIKELLSPYGVEVIGAAQAGLDEPEETEDSFAGNARIKAHAAAQATGLPALSDDSGIEVAALNGAPGVHTADWAETPEGRDFNLAMKKVWNLVSDEGEEVSKDASFHCTLCLAFPDGREFLYEGKVSGTLVWPIRGENGFGFDPMFLPNGESETFGEMEPQKKHSMSHRARAFKAFVADCFD